MEGLTLDSGINFLVALLALIAAIVVWRQKRTASFMADQLDAQFTADLLQLPQLTWLDEVQQVRWQRQVERFLEEKRFIGCAGLVLGEAQRHAIAGYACLLRLQPEAEHQDLYPTVREVLVYPDAFLVPPPTDSISEDGLELVDDEGDLRIGEQGPGQVVLSWADVEAALAGDAVNVVVHEFAHALDSEDSRTEGAPRLADYSEWSAVMAAEFARLQRHRRPPVLDRYGAESPAEFWCVTVEAFFQRPAALHKHHPALFALLVGYFALSPPIVQELAAVKPPA